MMTGVAMKPFRGMIHAKDSFQFQGFWRLASPDIHALTFAVSSGTSNMTRKYSAAPMAKEPNIQGSLLPFRFSKGSILGTSKCMGALFPSQLAFSAAFL